MRPKRKAPDRPNSFYPSDGDGEFVGGGRGRPQDSEARAAEVAPLLPPPEESLLKSPAAVANSESYLASLPLAPCAGVPSANCTSSVLAAASVAALGSMAGVPAFMDAASGGQDKPHNADEAGVPLADSCTSTAVPSDDDKAAGEVLPGIADGKALPDTADDKKPPEERTDLATISSESVATQARIVRAQQLLDGKKRKLATVMKELEKVDDAVDWGRQLLRS